MLTVISIICLVIIVLRFITLYKDPSLVYTKRSRVLASLIIPVIIIYIVSNFIFATFILVITTNLLIGFSLIAWLSKK